MIPSMPSEDSDEMFWKRRAKALSRQINFAWFLQAAAAPLLIVATLGAVAAIVVRRELPEISTLQIGIPIGAILLIVGIVSFVVSSRRFETPEKSMVRIEAEFGMNTALSAARAVGSPWPSRSQGQRKALVWHLPRTLAPPIGAIILLALGLLIPISARPKGRSRPFQPASGLG